MRCCSSRTISRRDGLRQNGDVLRPGLGLATANARFRFNAGHVGASRRGRRCPLPGTNIPTNIRTNIRPRCARRRTATAATELNFGKKYAAAGSAVEQAGHWPSSQILIVAIGKTLQGIDVEELHLTAKG